MGWSRLLLLGTALLAACNTGRTVHGPATNSSTRPGDSQDTTSSRSTRQITFNQARVSDDTLDQIERRVRVRIPDGEYWYDRHTGAVGQWGGPCAGFWPTGFDLGPVPRHASGGGTGVVVNGRELHPTDLRSLNSLVGYVTPGPYWLNARADYGVMINGRRSRTMGNLVMLARRAQSTQRGQGAYTLYKDWGTSRMSYASFGGGDFYVSTSSGATWYPGK